VLRCEPKNLELMNYDPMFRVSFEQAQCIRFCEKIHGYNAQVKKAFSLNFNGVQKRVDEITIQVSEDIVAAST